MLRTSKTVCWVGAICGLLLGASQTALGQCEATEASKSSASDGQFGDAFGWSVAISGNKTLVGARHDDGSAGAAYVFHFDGTTWVEQPKLTALDAQPSAYFGQAVALQGDVAIIGAPLDTNPMPLGGAAYIFRFDGTNWIEEQKLIASDNAALYFFGWSVAIDGDVAVVGAYTAGETGAAYVFRYDDVQGQWDEEKILTASDGVEFDQFGVSVAISGDAILVGAHNNDNDNGIDAGAVYVFRWTGLPDVWSEEVKIIGTDDGVDGNNFGWAVSLSGNVGLIGENTEALPLDAGKAYVYRYDTVSWNQEEVFTATAEAPDGNEFARSVAIEGNVAVVGAMRDDGDTTGAGAAYVYTYESGVWSEPAKLMASDGDLADDFGGSVAISGSMVLLGARQDAPAGSAYVFDGLDDGVPDSCAAACPGDADGDSEVGIVDFLMVLGAWGPNPGHPADFDGDGEVGIGDFLIVLGNWGPC